MLVIQIHACLAITGPPPGQAIFGRVEPPAEMAKGVLGAASVVFPHVKSRPIPWPRDDA